MFEDWYFVSSVAQKGGGLHVLLRESCVRVLLSINSPGSLHDC